MFDWHDIGDFQCAALSFEENKIAKSTQIWFNNTNGTSVNNLILVG